MFQGSLAAVLAVYWTHYAKDDRFLPPLSLFNGTMAVVAAALVPIPIKMLFSLLFDRERRSERRVFKTKVLAAIAVRKRRRLLMQQYSQRHLARTSDGGGGGGLSGSSRRREWTSSPPALPRSSGNASTGSHPIMVNVVDAAATPSSMPFAQEYDPNIDLDIHPGRLFVTDGHMLSTTRMCLTSCLTTFSRNEHKHRDAGHGGHGVSPTYECCPSCVTPFLCYIFAIALNIASGKKRTRRGVRSA